MKRVYPSYKLKMTTGQTNWPYVINLGNSIIGVSVLTMPFCFKSCGVILGTVILLCSAWLTSISCNLLVKAAFTARRRSYQYLAFHAVGHVGKLFVEMCIIGLLLGTCIAFYVIMGDLGSAIISKILGVENTDALRTGLLIIMALFIALPLALLRNLDSLSNINAISLGFYAVFVAEVFTAAFPNLWSGIWVTKVTYWNPEGVFKCLPIFSLAFACQTQLFVLYDALPEPSLQRMHHITKSAIGMCVSVYLCVGYFGYVAFCDEDIQGDILMNFRPTIFSETIKMGFVLSVAVSFPLVVFPCRASIYTMFFAKDHASHENIGGTDQIPALHFNMITLSIILGTMIIGILVPNIEIVLALTGSTMGSLISFIFPAIVFIRVMSMSKSSNNIIAQFVLFLGVTILLASTYVTVNGPTQDSQSVIKIVQPEPIHLPAELSVDKNIEPDGHIQALNIDAGEGEKPHRSVALKDDLGHGGDNLVEDKAQNQLGEKDKRQEPPNPQAPMDVKGDDDDTKLVQADNDDDIKNEKLGDTEVKGQPMDDPGHENAPDVANIKDTDEKMKVADVESDKGVEKKAIDETMKAEKETEAEEVKEKERKDADNEEAKELLKELKEQQKEQKLLIEEQRQIIADLKQHQKDAHGDEEAKQLQQQQLLLQQQQQQHEELLMMEQQALQQQQQQPQQNQAIVQQQQGSDLNLMNQQQQQQLVQQPQDQPIQQQQQYVQQPQIQVQPQQLPDQQQQPVQLQQQQQPVQLNQQQQQPVQLQQQQQPVQQQQQPVQQQQQQPIQQQQPVQLQQQQQPVQQQQQPVQQQQQPVQQQQQPGQLQQQQQPVQLQQQQQPVQQQQQQPIQQQQQQPIQQQQQPIQQQQPVQQNSKDSLSPLRNDLDQKLSDFFQVDTKNYIVKPNEGAANLQIDQINNILLDGQFEETNILMKARNRMRSQARK